MFEKHKLLTLSFISVVTVALVNFLAITFYLYWTVWWFDNITHFLGGLSMGLFWFFIFQKFYRFQEEPKLKNIIFIITLIVLTIGVGWEIFEFVTNTAGPSAGETYWQDTSYDLISDMVGALVAVIIVYKNKLHV